MKLISGEWQVGLMKIYWTHRSIPELSGLSREESGRVWRAAYWRSLRDWRMWAWLVGPVTLGGLVGEWLIGHAPLGGAIGSGIGGFIFGVAASHLMRPYIRAILSERELP
jgi:hypothetical protein